MQLEQSARDLNLITVFVNEFINFARHHIQKCLVRQLTPEFCVIVTQPAECPFYITIRIWQHQNQLAELFQSQLFCAHTFHFGQLSLELNWQTSVA